MRQGHAGSKTVLQQNPPVHNWGCQPKQVVLYNDHKTVVVVVAVVEVVVQIEDKDGIFETVFEDSFLKLLLHIPVHLYFQTFYIYF